MAELNNEEIEKILRSHYGRCDNVTDLVDTIKARDRLIAFLENELKQFVEVLNEAEVNE